MRHTSTGDESTRMHWTLFRLQMEFGKAINLNLGEKLEADLILALFNYGVSSLCEAYGRNRSTLTVRESLPFLTGLIVPQLARCTTPNDMTRSAALNLVHAYIFDHGCADRVGEVARRLCGAASSPTMQIADESALCSMDTTDSFPAFSHFQYGMDDWERWAPAFVQIIYGQGAYFPWT